MSEIETEIVGANAGDGEARAGQEAGVSGTAGRKKAGTVRPAAKLRLVEKTEAAAPARRKAAAKRKPARRRKVRVMVRWSREREELFLESLAATPNIAEAERVSGLSDRSVRRRREASADFRAKWLAALREGYAKLEAGMMHRALNGVEKAVWFGGKQVGTVIEYDDRLGLALLRMHRETVHGTKPITADEPVEELRARLKAHLSEMNRRMGGAG